MVNPNARLTEQQVEAIWNDRKANGTTIRQLAADYNVGVSTVADILKRRSWKDVTA